MSAHPLPAPCPSPLPSSLTCTACRLGSCDTYRHDLDLARGAGPGQTVHFPAGAVMARQGHAGTNMYSLCEGLVKLEQGLPDGQMRTVRVLKPGDLLGLELLSGQVNRYTATTLSQARACRTPVHRVWETAQHDSQLRQSLTAQWQQSLDEADFVIAHLSTGPARQRVARLLMHLTRRQARQLSQVMPREDMASLLGLTPETVSRTCAAFKREGLLHERAGILSVDQARLSAISEGSEMDLCAGPIPSLYRP